MEIVESRRHISVFVRIKSLLFPALALLLAVFLSIVPEWRTWWLGVSQYRLYNEPQYFTRIFIVIIAGSIWIWGFSWLLGRKIMIQFNIKRSMISFLVAYDARFWFGLFFVYPITLLFEELLFRAFGMIACIYILSFLPPMWLMSCSILLNALIFSVYHIHIYITTKNLALTGFYMLVSFFLGVLTGGLVFSIGVLGCWVVHVAIVSVIYLFWARKDFFPVSLVVEK